MFQQQGAGGYVESEPWWLIRPNGDGLYPGVLLLHGAGGDHEFAHPNQSVDAWAAIRAIVQAGFCVMAPDGRDGVTPDGSYTWGRDEATTTNRNAVAYAKANLGMADLPVAILGSSMGGVTGWNMKRRWPAEVRSIALVSAVSSLAHHTQPGEPFRQSILDAYGGVVPADHDPMLFTASGEWGPVAAWHTINDDLVPIDTARDMAEQVGYTLHELPSGAHTDAAWSHVDHWELIQHLRAGL